MKHTQKQREEILRAYKEAYAATNGESPRIVRRGSRYQIEQSHSMLTLAQIEGCTEVLRQRVQAAE